MLLKDLEKLLEEEVVANTEGCENKYIKRVCFVGQNMSIGKKHDLIGTLLENEQVVRLIVLPKNYSKDLAMRHKRANDISVDVNNCQQLQIWTVIGEGAAVQYEKELAASMTLDQLREQLQEEVVAKTMGQESKFIFCISKKEDSKPIGKPGASIGTCIENNQVLRLHLGDKIRIATIIGKPISYKLKDADLNRSKWFGIIGAPFNQENNGDNAILEHTIENKRTRQIA